MDQDVKASASLPTSFDAASRSAMELWQTHADWRRLVGKLYVTVSDQRCTVNSGLTGNEVLEVRLI
jgi:hypothetical protein